ncbi:MAG: GAF domain-containing sensor histidine kinase [Anaerolineae bacterium]|nr:GAF domain-containing sensor histidine kinase [Anaerolineae bacterium]
MTDTTDWPTQLAQLKKENAHLRNENQQLARQTAQLREVARLVVAEPGRPQLLEQLTADVARLVNAERAMIGTVLDDAIEFEHLVQAGRSQAVHLRFQANEGVAGWVMVFKRPYLGPEEVSGNGPRSVVAVPILNHQEHLLGVIQAQRARHSLPFSQKEVETLQTVAYQVAPGLERAQLFDQMQRWIDSFESLLGFSARLNGRLEPETLMRRLVEHAAGFLGADAGLAGLVVAGEIGSDGYWGQNQWHDFQANWSPREEESTPGWVRVNQCPYLTNDYQADSLANPTLIERFAVRNALCVPIMDAREEVLGFVELHNKGGGREPFTWSDAHFLESLTNSTAIALHNARLLFELSTERTRLAAFAARNMTLLEDERRRIARELHDEAGQVLIGIKLGLQVLGRRIPLELPEVRHELDRLRQQVNESTAQLKEIARTLRPPILDELGLEVALKRCIAEFEGNTGISYDFTTNNLTPRLPQPVETACYRLVQEALTNVSRHAQARQVWIELTVAEEQVRLLIQDDGCGFVIDQPTTAGLGLLGMQERVAMLGGTFEIVSTLTVGTTIKVLIPVPELSTPAETPLESALSDRLTPQQQVIL